MVLRDRHGEPMTAASVLGKPPFAFHFEQDDRSELRSLLEASTGIEPVYTDLQSRKRVIKNNDLRVQNAL